MEQKVIMIHQPDFIPWIGFFHKFLQVDEFVLLDHVTNHPKSRNWLRRVKIIVNGAEHWLSLPLKKHPEKSFVPIWELEVNKQDAQYQSKLLPTIQNSYKRAPFYAEVNVLLEEYFHDPEENLKKWNMRFIEKVTTKLEIPMPVVRETSTLHFESSKTEMLIDICNAYQATHWLYTGGVDGYLEPELFDQKGVGLIKHQFTHPVYKQFNSHTFVPGLSIVDILMNTGFEQTSQLIKHA